jgi:hypothetical protein
MDNENEFQYPVSVPTQHIFVMANQQLYFFFIFIVAPCILKSHFLSHTNKCTNYIIYYLKSVLIIDIKTLSYCHSSCMFRHITCHPQGALMFLARSTKYKIFSFFENRDVYEIMRKHMAEPDRPQMKI